MTKTIDKDKLCTLIAAKCMSVTEFFDSIKCSMAVWRSISNGKPIRLANIGRIAKALDVSVDDLLKS